MPVDVLIPEPPSSTLDTTFEPGGSATIDSDVGSVTNCGNCKDKTFRVRVQCTTCGESVPECGCASTPDELCMSLSGGSGNSPIPQMSGAKIKLTRTPWASVPSGLRNAVLSASCCPWPSGSTDCNGGPPTNIVVSVTVAPDNTCDSCSSWAALAGTVTDLGNGTWSVRGVDPADCSGTTICDRSFSFALQCDGNGGVKGVPEGGGLCCNVAASANGCINIYFPGGVTIPNAEIVEGPTYSPSFHVKYKVTVNPHGCTSTIAGAASSVVSMYIDITATTGTAGSGSSGGPDSTYKLYYGTFAPSGTPYDSCRYDVALGCCNGHYFSVIQLSDCVGASLTGTVGCTTGSITSVCDPFSLSGTYSFGASGTVDFVAVPVPVEGCGGTGGGGGSGACCDDELGSHPNLTVVMSGSAPNYVTTGTYTAVWFGSGWTFGRTGFGSYTWVLQCSATNLWTAIGVSSFGQPNIRFSGYGTCNPAAVLLQDGSGATLSVTL